MKRLRNSLLLVSGLLFLLVTFSGESVQAATAVFINELHYDNDSSDTGEAVEVAGPAGTDLSGWSIVLYNGNGGASYGTINLSGTLPNQDDGCGTLSFDRAGIQNGSPDGLALVDNGGSVVQFLSYEGSFAATNGPANGMNSTDIGVSEPSNTPAGQSLQVTGTGDMDDDFTWNAPATASFGAVNPGQDFTGCTPIDNPPTVTNTVPADNATGVALDANIEVTFSEDVTATDPWATINCDTSGNHTVASSGGPQMFTLNPDADFVNDETCTVTVLAAQIADQDGTADNMAADHVFTFDTASASGGSNPFINELHYDNDSSDIGEAVEVAGLAGTDLTDWTIVLYNGSNGTSYGTINLSGVIPNQQAGCGTLSFDRAGIQNGSPDGLALVDNNGVVVEFLSYEGSLTATDGPANGMTSTDIGVAEPSNSPAGESLQLKGTGSSATDFSWSSPSTDSFGDVNDGQTFTCGGSNPAPSLLLSEIKAQPFGAEFVEIFNPTDSTVDLSDVYLTDATFAPNSQFYYNIVTGDGGGGGFSDFNARFPDGATIASGEYQTIALNGSDSFTTAFGMAPTYELYEDSGSADAIPDMREATAGSIDGQGGLSDDGEFAVLYHWDGMSDLVTDLDYVVWGDKNEAVDKTGVSIDGPDADSDDSPYQDDTAIASQDTFPSGEHASGNSWQRDDNDEGAETKSGGNGAMGHDETSEDLSNTWCENAPTPNSASVCISLIISEILYDSSNSPESDWEWVEIYNNGGSAVDLSGFVLDDANGSAHGSANIASGTVPAGGSAVLFNGSAITAADFEAAWGPGNYIAVSSWDSLNNTGDKVGLWDSLASYTGDDTAHANAIVSVTYTDDPPFPDSNNSASIYLTDLAADANDGNNWALSTDGGATPVFTGYTSAAGGGNSGVDVGSPSAGLPEVCGDPATLIHVIQGSGLVSLEAGNDHTIEGVVVGDYQDTTTGLRGFFVQEDDGQADGNAATSEGIFVFDTGFGVDVNVGDLVRVRGTVTEFGDPGVTLTELGFVTDVQVCSSGHTVTPATVSLPVAGPDDWEPFEGMLVAFSQTLYVTEHFNLGRFGNILLSSSDRLFNPTHVAAPGAAANAVAAANDLNQILLDDANTQENRDPIIYPDPGLSATNSVRGGDTVANLTGVLDQRFDEYRIQPVGTVDFTHSNPRSASPADVGGSLKVATMNVLNYFSTLRSAGSVCGPAANQGCRGAHNANEFMRQRDKIVNALVEMDADIVGLVEIENHATDDALNDLVAGINAVAGAGTYAALNTGPVGTDAIRVAFIYKPATVMPDGPFAVLDSSVDPTFIDTKNRPVLAQTFVEIASGEKLTVAVNHLKSKGSACDDVGDPNTGDEQGNCNGTRTSAATAMANWLATDPTGSGDRDFLIIGDLNAYAMEDPVTALKNAGYTNLIESFLGGGAYSFVFGGEWGYLDHALANESMTAQVTGVTEWHINADEPRSLDYNEEFKSAGQITSLYNDEPYRSSDHDPLIIGLDLADQTCNADLSTVNVIMGTSRNDNIKGTPGDDVIYGLGGNDRIEGLGGNDCLIGGDGNDTLHGGDGHDVIWGGDVNNATTYSRDNDKLYGGDGEDKMYGGDRDDRLQGDDGDDMLWGNGRRDKLYGNDGNDYLDGGDDRDTLNGNDGDDEMHGGEGDDYLNGADGHDALYGDGGRDKMYGGNDNDYMEGGSGDDTMSGNRGYDEMWGGEGRDRVDGGHEDDMLYGEDDDDKLYGGRGDDMLDGGADYDRLDGSSGTDTCTTGESLRSCELP